MSIWQKLFNSRFNRPNQAPNEEDEREGNVSPLDALKIDMDDGQLLNLAQSWKTEFEKGEQEPKSATELNTRYWKGNHDAPEGVDSGKFNIDNVLFEAVETLIPLGTKKNPEPVCAVHPIEPELANRLEKTLQDIAERNAMRDKFKKLTRQWLLSRRGYFKVSYSLVEDSIVLQNVRPQDVLLDPKGYIDERGIFYGRGLGHKREDTADLLAKRFPDKKEEIMKEANQKGNSLIAYMEWWTDEYFFYQFKDVILGKYKNPNWNWQDMAEERPMMDEMTGQQKVSEDGQPLTEPVEVYNHWPRPMMPWICMSFLTTNEKPFDDTSLMEQAIPLQDLVNKRISQMDRNADNANIGLIFNGEYFTDVTARRADRALRQGKSISADGPPDQVVSRTVSPPLPGFVMDSMVDARNRVRDIMGTSGSSPAAIKGEDTVRGKIIIAGKDDSRVGGGISSSLEQVADTVFNWFVQMIYVYYDQPRPAIAAGVMQGGYAEISAKDLIGKTIRVTVKEGSLIPDDQLTRRNNAVDMWAAGSIDPMGLFEALGDSNPKEKTVNLIKWLIAKKTGDFSQYMPEAAPPPMPPAAPPGMPGAPAPEMAPPAAPNAAPAGPIPSQPEPSGDMMNAVPIPQ